MTAFAVGSLDIPRHKKLTQSANANVNPNLNLFFLHAIFDLVTIEIPLPATMLCTWKNILIQL